MLINEAITQCKALTGQVVDDMILVRWLSELDGRLAFEFYRADAWTPYDPEADAQAELLVPFPWDGLYVHHLAARTYFADGEYDRYENELVMCEKVLSDFRAFMQRTQAKMCGCGFPMDKTGGSAVTVIPGGGGDIWKWLSAYATAVKHGFKGTEEEWIESLQAGVNDILWYTDRPAAAVNDGVICTVEDSAITEDHIVNDVIWADPENIMSDVTWHTYPGVVTFTGTCSAPTSVDFQLLRKDSAKRSSGEIPDCATAYEPDIVWEQGGFSTATWTKGASNKYVRFKIYPKLSGVKYVKVDFPSGYDVYFGIRGASAAVQHYESFFYELADTEKTELNLTVRHEPADTTITVAEVAANIKVTFYPDFKAAARLHDALFDEVNGLLVNSSPLKIGLYGASIVKGGTVSDYSSTCTGDTVNMAEIGYTSFRKCISDKTWANKFTAYMETNYPNVTVENWAVGGSTAESYYDMLSKSLANGNSPLNLEVDVAIIMMGNNGRTTDMKANIEGFANIIRLFREQGVQVLFMTPTAAFNERSTFVLNTYQIMQCAKIAATYAGASSIDAFHWIEDYCEANGISLAYDSTAAQNFLNDDNLHPNDTGHDIIFRCLRSLLKV